MIDSHCHLDHSPLNEDLDNVISRAKEIGVKLLLTISTDIKSFRSIEIIINKYPNVYGTVGIHPHETKLNTSIKKKELIKMKKNQSKIIGIGETGLDYYYSHSDKNIQKASFIQHIEAALDLNLPLVVHSRDAEDDTFNILNDYSSKKLKILMHCFTGSKKFSEKLLSINSHFSFSGIITFNNAKELQNTATSIPLNKLLIETDSPFLAPVPNRGKNNEPSFIVHTIAKLSKIKNVSSEIIEEKTTKNFKELFGIN